MLAEAWRQTFPKRSCASAALVEPPPPVNPICQMCPHADTLLLQGLYQTYNKPLQYQAY